MTATGTFDGVSFEIYGDGLDMDGGVQMSDELIPGGDITYRDVAGRTPRHFMYRVYCTSDAAFASLMAKRGVTGTLTTTVDGTMTATLGPVRRTGRNWDGKTDGTAEFWEG